MQQTTPPYRSLQVEETLGKIIIVRSFPKSQNIKVAYLNFDLILRSLWLRLIRGVSLLGFLFLGDFIPIEVRILLIAFFLESLFEELLAVVIIRFLIESKVPAVS